MKKAIGFLVAALMVALLLPTLAFAEGNVAKIGQDEYATLQGAIDDVGNGETITLIDNVDSDNDILSNGGKDFTLDLNGHEIKLSGQDSVFVHGNAKLNITGTGRIYSESQDKAVFIINGSDDPAAKNYSVLTVGENVTVEGIDGAAAITIGGRDVNPIYGIVVNIDGTLIGKSKTLFVNQNVVNPKDNPIIVNINETAKLSSSADSVIEVRAYTNMTIENGAEITGDWVGILFSEGSLTVNGGTITAAAAENGHALSIANDGTEGDIEITINGGNFVTADTAGGSTIGETIIATTIPAEEITGTKLKSIKINGGNFEGKIHPVSAEAIFKGSINGGNFSEDPTAFLAAGTKLVYDESAEIYKYTVAKEPAAARPYSPVHDITAPAGTPASAAEENPNTGAEPAIGAVFAIAAVSLAAIAVSKRHK